MKPNLWLKESLKGKADGGKEKGQHIAEEDRQVD